VAPPPAGAPWSGVVSITIVEGKDLMAMDDNGFSDPYARVFINGEKHKTKKKERTLNPKWKERFDFRLTNPLSTKVEFSVWDWDLSGKDDLMGTVTIDLNDYPFEQTNTLWLELSDGGGHILVLVTVSGLVGWDPLDGVEEAQGVTDEKERERILEEIMEKERKQMEEKFLLKNTGKLGKSKDVGWLCVRVHKAQGLAAADVGGKSDPICIVELTNERLQTHTEYKTLDPVYNKIFKLTLRDLHAPLEITLFDEDKVGSLLSFEFLGQIKIPMLQIRQGEKRWYQLKDKKCTGRVKGALQLQMWVYWNDVKALQRTINPKEEKYIRTAPKFQLATMKRNIARLQRMGDKAAEGGKQLAKILAWENKALSAGATIGAAIGILTFELWQAAAGPFALFLIMGIVSYIKNMTKDPDEYPDESEDVDEDEAEAEAAKAHKADKKAAAKEAKKTEEKKSFKEKMQEIQDICLQVQEGLDMAATMGEKIKNWILFQVPWLSWLATVAFGIGTVGLAIVPLRLIALGAVMHIMTKKLRKPNAIPHNEVIDYLSRIPSDRDVMMYREIRPDAGIGSKKKTAAPPEEA